jgi:hypothetical protein
MPSVAGDEVKGTTGQGNVIGGADQEQWRGRPYSKSVAEAVYPGEVVGLEPNRTRVEFAIREIARRTDGAKLREETPWARAYEKSVAAGLGD